MEIGKCLIVEWLDDNRVWCAVACARSLSTSMAM
jgi:hypothetical protein